MKRLLVVLILLVVLSSSSLNVQNSPRASAQFGYAELYLPLVANQFGPPLSVLSNHFTYSSYSTTYVLGEVQNNTDNHVWWVKVAVNFFNAANWLVGTDYNWTWLDNLPAHEKTCFRIYLTTPTGWTYYTFEPPTYSGSGHAYPNLTILTPSGSVSSSTGYTLMGQVRNDLTTTVKYVQVAGTLYNAAGRVVGCGGTYVNSTDLSPGQVSSFRVSYYGRNYSDVSSYRMQVDGNVQ